MTEALAQMNTTTDILVLAAALLAALCYLYFRLWKNAGQCSKCTGSAHCSIASARKPPAPCGTSEAKSPPGKHFQVMLVIDREKLKNR